MLLFFSIRKCVVCIIPKFILGFVQKQIAQRLSVCIIVSQLVERLSHTVSTKMSK